MARFNTKLLLGGGGVLLAGATASTYPGCTSTMFITYSRLPTPPYWPQCSWDSTERIYPATTTVSRPVDCHGCDSVVVREQPVVHCPARVVTATATEVTPSTAYRTVCSASA